MVDKKLDSASATTKPIKVGGRYYGYIPYITLFKLPKNITLPYGASFPAIVELLVSPLGRLADYKVHLGFIEGEQVINMNISLAQPRRCEICSCNRQTANQRLAGFLSVVCWRITVNFL